MNSAIRRIGPGSARAAKKSRGGCATASRPSRAAVGTRSRVTATSRRFLATISSSRLMPRCYPKDRQVPETRPAARKQSTPTPPTTAPHPRRVSGNGRPEGQPHQLAQGSLGETTPGGVDASPARSRRAPSPRQRQRPPGRRPPAVRGTLGVPRDRASPPGPGWPGGRTVSAGSAGAT